MGLSIKELEDELDVCGEENFRLQNDNRELKILLRDVLKYSNNELPIPKALRDEIREALK